MRISLLPGWGLGPGPLQPLADALARHHEVQLLALPECATAEQALDELDKQIPSDSWLVGWSLGGMLATALAHRRGKQCPGLISLASNPSFVPREDWPHAMASAEFRGFSRMAGRDWQGTLQHFVTLCLQGEQSKADDKQLSIMQSPVDAAQGQQSLSWLAQLDNRVAIAELQCPQLHLLAAQDALVPAAAIKPLAQLNTAAQVELVQGSHAFVSSQAEWLAQRLVDFIASHAKERADA